MMKPVVRQGLMDGREKRGQGEEREWRREGREKRGQGTHTQHLVVKKT